MSQVITRDTADGLLIRNADTVFRRTPEGTWEYALHINRHQIEWRPVPQDAVPTYALAAAKAADRAPWNA